MTDYNKVGGWMPGPGITITLSAHARPNAGADDLNVMYADECLIGASSARNGPPYLCTRTDDLHTAFAVYAEPHFVMFS